MNPQPNPSSSGDTGSERWRRGILSLGIPTILVVVIAIAAPFSSTSLFGIKGSILALFACAPLTALCLLVCNLLIASRDTAAGGRE